MMIRILITSLVFAATLILQALPVHAVTGADWIAGNIIDDSVFTDKNSMSVSDIQNFLNQKVGTGTYGTPGQCDTYGVKVSELGGGTRAQFGASRSNPTPFTCLKDYYEVPKLNPGPEVPASNYGGAPIPVGAKSAAQLIYDAAQQYNISPKVLLVTIQKESVGPLITDDWPFRSQYTYAMGAHCPDSGPGGSANCDPNYSGFSLQIAESAALFRYYLDNMNQPWWPYKKLGNNTILYNPSTSCGSSVVNIQSSATAALYTYTPYQPNASALANMYGTGDSCSAYGNRNFWRMYNDWFGTTYGGALTPTAYRLYNTRTRDHYYTTKQNERFNAKQQGYKEDSATFDVSTTQEPGMIPIYNLYNGRIIDHWLVPDGMNRYWGLVFGGYRDDGVAFYAYPASPTNSPTPCPSGTPVYNLWHNGNTGHFYSTSSLDRFWGVIFGGYVDDLSATFRHPHVGSVSFCSL